MNAEKIIEMIQSMGGGVVLIFAILISVYLVVALMRMSRGKKDKNSSSQNPAGEDH